VKRVNSLVVAIGAVAVTAGIVARAQTPQPVDRITFKDAVQRAIDKNPTSAIAAAGILRADALLRQTRSQSGLQVAASAVTSTSLNGSVQFQGTTVTPRNSVSATVDATIPVYAPAAWARRAQAEDQRNVAELTRANTARQTALETADAFLTIIALRRIVEATTRARETADSHFELARELQEQGTGSRLNQLRAQQELSTDEGLVENARLALYRAQEALGVLLVEDGPVDAADEPDFAVPAAEPVPAGLLNRTDLKLFTAQQTAAERVVHDSVKDRFPSLAATFEEQSTYPALFFSPTNSWRILLQASVPIFDAGLRTGQKLERQSALDVSRANLAGALTQASSEVRATREAVASTERALVSKRAAAEQAQEVVNITNISFRAGGATNIEVVDAQQRARDADLTAAVAEDALRRARLDLMDALGLFP
jgi:outer membrane protein TolC